MAAGLELGADDYIPTSFSPRMLVARARTVLRRPKGLPQEEARVIIINKPSRSTVAVYLLLDLGFGYPMQEVRRLVPG